MNEFHDAAEAAWAITCDRVFVYWAPGDATVYRVTLVKAVEYGFNAMSDQADVHALLVLAGSYGYERSLLVPARKNWTIEAFVHAFGQEYLGWWSGVRPLLAALEWTPSDHRSLDYDPRDAIAVGAVATSLGMRI